MESFGALLKRGYYGTYRKMSIQHLKRYINEFCGRHNVRDSHTGEQMGLVVIGMVGKRLSKKNLVGKRCYESALVVSSSLMGGGDLNVVPASISCCIHSVNLFSRSSPFSMASHRICINT